MFGSRTIDPPSITTTNYLVLAAHSSKQRSAYAHRIGVGPLFLAFGLPRCRTDHPLLRTHDALHITVDGTGVAVPPCCVFLSLSLSLSLFLAHQKNRTCTLVAILWPLLLVLETYAYAW